MNTSVLEHGMIWTGVTRLRLWHNIKHAQYILQCMLVGCMGASFNAVQVLVGDHFWLMRRSRCRSFWSMSQHLESLACLWPAQPQTNPSCWHPWQPLQAFVALGNGHFYCSELFTVFPMIISLLTHATQVLPAVYMLHVDATWSVLLCAAISLHELSPPDRYAYVIYANAPT